MPVIKVLDLSTAHLPARLIEPHSNAHVNSYDGVTATRLSGGWLLVVPQDPDAHAADYGEHADFDGPPPEVVAVQRYARSLGCEYVLFDQDAEREPGLPVWEW